MTKHFHRLRSIPLRAEDAKAESLSSSGKRMGNGKLWASSIEVNIRLRPCQDFLESFPLLGSGVRGPGLCREDSDWSISERLAHSTAPDLDSIRRPILSIRLDFADHDGQPS